MMPVRLRLYTCGSKVIRATETGFRAIWFTVALGVATAAPVTIGYRNNPPQTYRDAAGNAVGFVPDVLNEAARRERIRLTWVYADANTQGGGLETTDVALWPAGVATPDRRKLFYITTPWWHNALLLLTGESITQLADLDGRAVARTRDLEAALRTGLPRARPVSTQNHAESATRLCEGAVDALLTDRMILDQLLLSRPQACKDAALRVLAVPGVTLDLSILARPAYRETADRLRGQIENMEEDGTVAAIALRYPAVSAGSAPFLAAVLEAQHRNRLLKLALIFIGALLVVSAGLLYWVFLDSLRRKRTEAALRQTNADLELFSNAASHDLAEPLRNMSVFSEVLDRRYGSRLDEEGRRFLAIIHDGAQRMHGLLESLGQYTRVSMDAEPDSEVDVRKVLDEACANLMQEIEATRALVTATELPRIRFNRQQLLQLLQNLIANALKYRSDQPPRIDLSAERSGSEWIIEVRDNGMGIPAEHREKVFGVFKRLHGRDVPGTGIGLAICKKIVERSGGRIWVEPGEGAGSSFRFTVPVHGR